MGSPPSKKIALSTTELPSTTFYFDTMASFPKGMDVVGVDSESNGRHCTQHHVCGHFVKADDILYCKWAVQKFDLATPESCVQVFKLAADGLVGCHVGFLPRRVIKSSKNEQGEKDGGKSYDGMWLEVITDLRLSGSPAERSRSTRNLGIVYCHVANYPWLVGIDPFETEIQFPDSLKEKSFELPPPEIDTHREEDD